MQNLQYDLFTEKGNLTLEESHAFRLDMQAMIDSSIRVRKSLFAKLSDQNKLILKLIQEVEELKGKKKTVILSFQEEEQTLFRKYK